MPAVTVTRTYLEMRSPADQAGRARVPAGHTVARESVTPALYRWLYGAVGHDYHWRDRLSWSEERVAAHLAAPGVAVWVLRHGAEPAGFFELARHEDGSVEIAYFGLVPAAIGRGAGKALLTAAIDAAWTSTPVPSRVWLHTCTLDHPAALANYRSRGFSVTHTETYVADVPQA